MKDLPNGHYYFEFAQAKSERMLNVVNLNTGRMYQYSEVVQKENKVKEILKWLEKKLHVNFIL